MTLGESKMCVGQHGVVICGNLLASVNQLHR